MTRARSDADTIARLTREVKALTEERAHMRRLAHAYRAERKASDLNDDADVTKALAAARRAHDLVDEITTKLIDGSES